MKIEFELPQLTLEKQIEEIVMNTTEKAIGKYYEKSTTREWLSLKEGAAYANVSYGSFMKFRELGLKVCEIDGIKRVSKKEIDRFLEQNSF